MGATQSSDVNFVAKVYNDHIQAYFDRKLGLGQLAVKDKTLQAQPGETVTFPYFTKIGDAQEPAETEGLEVDALVDDSFDVTVKEIGKAVGWKDKALRKSYAGKTPQAVKERHMKEASDQIARVFAEKVDKDIITTINANGASKVITQGGAGELMTIQRLVKNKILAFGDKANDAVAVAMHSMDYMNMLTDSTAGFLKADANDPFWNVPGFMGRIGGMALFVLDTMPEDAVISGKKSYFHFYFKANAFGIYMAQDMQPETDRDILHRENLLSATMWYGTLSLHAKVASDDLRIAKGSFDSGITA